VPIPVQPHPFFSVVLIVANGTALDLPPVGGPIAVSQLTTEEAKDVRTK
jgi:hypothetical protein